MNPEVRIWFQHCFLNVVVLHKLGISPNGWMVYFMENPIYKWMRTGGSPILGHLHVFACFSNMGQTYRSLVGRPWMEVIFVREQRAEYSMPSDLEEV